MRGALIHGVLLAVMLVYGYRTWTRDKSVKPDLGSVVLWNKAESDLASLEYRSDRKIVRVERRGDGPAAYWWGLETTIDRKPKPIEKKPDPPGAGSGSGSAAGSGAGSGSAAKAAGSGSAAVAKAAGSGSAAAGSGSAAAGSGSGSAVAQAGSGSGSGSAAAPPAPEMEESRKTTEFPLGEKGDKLVKAYAEARAIRDLGVPTDAQKKDYKLADATNTITVTFRDNTKRTFVVGGPVFGGGDKYVQDKDSGKAYVFSRDVVNDLEVGESSIHLIDPRGFDISKIEQVTVEAQGKAKHAVRVTTGVEDQKVKTWGDAETKRANQTLANFIDNANNLRPRSYDPKLTTDALTPVVKLTYKDAAGGTLGTLALYKIERAGELPEGVELDPANPPKGRVEYYVMSEKTKVPGLVSDDTAQRAENDLPIVFSDKPPEQKLDPAKNPFKDMPLPPRPATGSGSAGSGSAAAPIPGLTPPPGHGAPAPPAPAGAGSAAKPPAPPTGAAKPPAPPAPAGSAAKPPAPPADPHKH